MKVGTEHPSALGKVIHNFQTLETSLCLTLGGFISDDQIVGRIITTNLSFGRLLDTLAGFAHYLLKGELRTQLLDLVKRASELEQERNKAVHSVYLGPEGDEFSRLKFSVTRKTGLKEIQEEESMPWLLEVSDAIGVLLEDIHSFLNSMMAVDPQFARRIGPPEENGR